MPNLTRQQAINAHCRSCICDEDNGGRWTEQVGVCSSTDCPLWQYRPIPSNASEWVKLRDPDLVPKGWEQFDHPKAIKSLYSEAGARVSP